MLKIGILPEYDMGFPKTLSLRKENPFFFKQAKKFNTVLVIIPGL